MLEAWLFRGMIWALSRRSVIGVKQHPLCWRSLNPTTRRAGFSVSASAVPRHTVGATQELVPGAC